MRSRFQTGVEIDLLKGGFFENRSKAKSLSYRSKFLNGLQSLDGINLHYTSFKNNSQLSESAKKAGLKIGSWTVNELSDLAILQQQGVEWITTNQPLQFQKQLKEIKQ